jgi:uncharacterized protein (TIGR03083 family)
MPLGPAVLIDRLRRDGESLVALVGDIDFALPVPGCPGWSVQDLVGHLGSVHRWATEIVRTGSPAEEPAAPLEQEELIRWFGQGVPTLLSALRAAVPGQECWTFGPRPRLVDFWIRRQALETAVHRWDLLDALGARADLDPELAADGVDEVATMMFPRQIRLDRLPPLDEAIVLVCYESGQRSTIGGDGSSHPEPIAATVTGPASDLLLLLWRRLPLDGTRVTVAGDKAAAEQVLSSALTP